MDKISIKNIVVYGYHGAIKEENVLGQKFIINIDMYTSLKKAGINDNLEETIHYGYVYNDIVNIATKKNYKLIEALGENICKILFKKYNMNKIIIEIKKPNAPIPGIFDYVSITLEREKKDYE
ncbi:dihydroneopterin aldolase [Hypnocyclicus thermotrophus]|uniref:7,8-dihydroneopterin aldolase n=1 Tax=Hypnocyclicus thermotrophus TaxID=1627895 RepID=A0AA46I694_9FUSO|nr:dihydroneopterin aldolase [Hypnocyclicus thermotrophus]TDT71412.1 dihydroneopterin aldolase [Hypnocyclicus thermotrophus]